MTQESEKKERIIRAAEDLERRAAVLEDPGNATDFAVSLTLRDAAARLRKQAEGP